MDTAGTFACEPFSGREWVIAYATRTSTVLVELRGECAEAFQTLDEVLEELHAKTLVGGAAQR